MHVNREGETNTEDRGENPMLGVSVDASPLSGDVKVGEEAAPTWNGAVVVAVSGVTGRDGTLLTLR